MRHNHQQINPAYHRRRARLHLWQDGIFEILIGIATVLFGALSAVLSIIAEATRAQIIVEVVLMVILFFTGSIVFRRLSETLKTWLTYPRSGFVRMRRMQPETSVLTLMLCVVLCVPIGIVLALLLVYGMTVPRVDMSLFFLSGLLSLSAVTLATRIHQKRLYGLSAGILFIGGGLSAFGPRGESGIALLLLFTGLLIMLSGGVALWRYLQRHPLRKETTHGSP